MTLRPLPVPRLGFRPCGLRRRRWSIVGLAAFDSPFGPSSASRPSTRRSVRHPALQPSTRRSDCFSALRLRSSSRSNIRLATSPDPFRAPRSSLAVEPTTRPENHGGHCCLPGFFRFAVPRGSAETKLEKWGRPSWNDGLALLPIFIHHRIRLLFPCGIRGFLPWPFQVLPSVSVRPFLARNQRLCSFPESRQRNQPVDN